MSEYFLECPNICPKNARRQNICQIECKYMCKIGTLLVMLKPYTAVCHQQKWSGSLEVKSFSFLVCISLFLHFFHSVVHSFCLSACLPAWLAPSLSLFPDHCSSDLATLNQERFRAFESPPRWPLRRKTDTLEPCHVLIVCCCCRTCRGSCCFGIPQSPSKTSLCKPSRDL